MGQVSLVMHEGSFPLGPYRQMIGCPADEDLGGGQHVEAPGRRPALSVLIIHPEAHLQSSVVMKKDW